MTPLEIILFILLVAALGIAGWFFIAHRIKARDTVEKISDAIKDAKQ